MQKRQRRARKLLYLFFSIRQVKLRSIKSQVLEFIIVKTIELRKAKVHKDEVRINWKLELLNWNYKLVIVELTEYKSVADFGRLTQMKYVTIITLYSSITN